MLLTEDQAQERLNSENNLANRFVKNSEGTVEYQVIEISKKPPNSRGAAVPKDIRTEIATRARLGTDTQAELAREFKTPQSSISHIENGKTKGIDEAQVEENISKVRDRALERLMASLGLLTDDKLSGCSARDLSSIAANMGRVVEKTLPKQAEQNNIQLVIYSPEIRQERNFKTIEV